MRAVAAGERDLELQEARALARDRRRPRGRVYGADQSDQVLSGVAGVAAAASGPRSACPAGSRASQRSAAPGRDRLGVLHLGGEGARVRAGGPARAWTRPGFDVATRIAPPLGAQQARDLLGGEGRHHAPGAVVADAVDACPCCRCPPARRPARRRSACGISSVEDHSVSTSPDGSRRSTAPLRRPARAALPAAARAIGRGQPVTPADAEALGHRDLAGRRARRRGRAAATGAAAPGVVLLACRRSPRRRRLPSAPTASAFTSRKGESWSTNTFPAGSMR